MRSTSRRRFSDSERGCREVWGRWRYSSIESQRDMRRVATRPAYRWMGTVASRNCRYLLWICRLRASTRARRSCRVMCLRSISILPRKIRRCISLHSYRMRERVTSVQPCIEVGFCCHSEVPNSKTSSLTFRGRAMSTSSERIDGCGPCASAVLKSRKQIWYHSKDRTWRCKGVRLVAEV